MLLNNENFIKEVKNEIPKIITNEKGDKMADILTDWDKFKNKIKKIAIYHSNKRKRIQKLVKELILKINSANTNIRDKESYKAQLEKMEQEETMGMEIWAGKFHHIYKQGKELYKREEKRKGGEKALDTLVIDGKTITNKAEIMKEIKNYYKQLYSTQCIDNNIIQQYLKDTQCKIITSDHKNLCEEFISVEEVKSTINKLATKKSSRKIWPHCYSIRNSKVRWHPF